QFQVGKMLGSKLAQPSLPTSEARFTLRNRLARDGITEWRDFVNAPRFVSIPLPSSLVQVHRCLRLGSDFGLSAAQKNALGASRKVLNTKEQRDKGSKQAK